MDSHGVSSPISIIFAMFEIVSGQGVNSGEREPGLFRYGDKDVWRHLATV